MSENNEENKKEELMTIWTTYSSYCEEITNKRQTINAYFIGIVSTIVGFIIGFWGTLGLILSIIGLVISLFWLLYICSFRKLNSAKFDVLIDVEKQLGINIYSLEWEKAKKSKYIEITKIEILLTILFILGFIALIVISILKTGGVC